MDISIQNVDRLKVMIEKNKDDISKCNKYITSESLEKVQQTISEFKSYSLLVKQEGIESFDTAKIENIGSQEWRDFILAAKSFASNQHTLKHDKDDYQNSKEYPIEGDHCLLCHQPLSDEALRLLRKTWEYLKSEAEGKLTKAQEKIDKIRLAYLNLNFDFFPENNNLTIWLNEKHPEILNSLKTQVSDAKKLVAEMVTACQTAITSTFTSVQIGTNVHDTLIQDLETEKDAHLSGQSVKKLADLSKQLTYYVHKQKLQDNIVSIEQFVTQRKWIADVSSFDWRVFKQSITLTEKRLSEKYYNIAYVERLNSECEKLSINVDLVVDPKGAEGKSNRKLMIKDKNPSVILSESEQKVIALADFLAEMDLSEVNKGLIFDDPVTSLDEYRKINIAKRLVEEAQQKQIIIFSHDLVFVFALIEACKDQGVLNETHWIENKNNSPGKIWLRNAPSYEKDYKSEAKAQEYLNKANKSGPQEREDHLKNGFAALRTSYEALVVFELFKGVVQRFNERVSIDSLPKVNFDTEIRDTLLDGFYNCCRHMEGHIHSDKYASAKPSPEALQTEIQRFITIRSSIRNFDKPSKN